MSPSSSTPSRVSRAGVDRLLVIGAGIMGLGIAWRCAARGMDVVVVDATEIGAAASWAAGGMVAPHAEVEFFEDPGASPGDWHSVGRGMKAIHRFPIPRVGHYISDESWNRKIHNRINSNCVP